MLGVAEVTALVAVFMEADGALPVADAALGLEAFIAAVLEVAAFMVAVEASVDPILA